MTDTGTEVPVGDVLVIFEGTKRLGWDRAGDCWQLRSVWPSRIQRRAVEERLRAGGRILVVLDSAPAGAVALCEEVPRRLPGVRFRDLGDGELLSVEVSPLDWLPADIRARGRAFLAAAQAQLAGRPRVVTPPVLFESAALPEDCVRFAYAARSGALSLRSALEEAVLLAFDRELTPAAGPR